MSGVGGDNGQGGVAAIELRLALSMENKKCGIPKERERLQGSVGLMDRTGSQNLSLDSPSVWRAKTDALFKKMKEFRGRWGEQNVSNS